MSSQRQNDSVGVSEFTAASDLSRSRARSSSQVDLTDAQLDDEIPRVLESVNPLADQKRVVFCYKSREYVSAVTSTSTVALIHMETYSLLKSSPEALLQEDTFELSERMLPNVSEQRSTEDPDVTSVEANVNASEIDEKKDGEKVQNQNILRAMYLTAKPKRMRKIPNAFNFCDQATQTKKLTTHHAASQTFPPVYSELNFQVTPSSIFDAYHVHHEKSNKQHVSADAAKGANSKQGMEWMSAYKLADRVVCQNMFNEVAMDFRYYEDPADEFRSGGSLLPLWSFHAIEDSGQVTDLEWSTKYLDLIIVTYGTLDVADKGGLAVLSLKNPLHPEYWRPTPSAALSLATHPKHWNLIAVGLNDGHIFIYDLTSNEMQPLFSSEYNMKHIRGVTVMMWEPVVEGRDPSLITMSSDGQVISWQMGSSNMVATRILMIPFLAETTFPRDILDSDIYGTGFCFAFHPTEPNIYLIGTQLGFIFKCSTLHATSVIFKYFAHHLPVLRIRYNIFCPKIFLTCSPDCTVKIWEDEISEPLLSFEIGFSVFDVAWVPQTSTAFIAITAEGAAHVFDLHVSRLNEIHRQGVVSVHNGNVPSRMALNTSLPIVALGDRFGTITTMKLSPNLRMPAKQQKKEVFDIKELEIRKLERVLSFMKPKHLLPPPDKPSILL